MEAIFGLAVVFGLIAIRAHTPMREGYGPVSSPARQPAASSTEGLPAAPDVEIVMYQGAAAVGSRKIRLSQLWGKGKPVVLNYFAGLCPPCRTELPRSVGRLTRGSLVVDVDQYEVLVDGREVRLTTIEFKLLRTLMESPGRVCTRDQLLATIHPFDEAAVVDRAIDVHIGRLREKLGDDPAQPRFIQTVRGFGYKLL